MGVADDVREGAVDGRDNISLVSFPILLFQGIWRDYFDRAEHEASDLEFRYMLNW